MTDIYIDGKLVKRLDITLDGVSTPPVEPPKEPVRPPKEEPPLVEQEGVTVKSLGLLERGNLKQRRFTVPRNEISAYMFVVPEDTSASVVFFTFGPQQTDTAGIRVWVSETPGGVVVPGRHGYVENAFIRRGDTFGIASPILGRGQERRGNPISAGKEYYLNVECFRGGALDTIMKIGGNL